MPATVWRAVSSKAAFINFLGSILNIVECSIFLCVQGYYSLSPAEELARSQQHKSYGEVKPVKFKLKVDEEEKQINMNCAQFMIESTCCSSLPKTVFVRFLSLFLTIRVFRFLISNSAHLIKRPRRYPKRPGVSANDGNFKL